jgi:hypothetical protein
MMTSLELQQFSSKTENQFSPYLHYQVYNEKGCRPMAGKKLTKLLPAFGRPVKKLSIW